ncbi:MAG: T9SS type A sorting domain-containing protein [Candidatus Eisenbacteria bacterium]|nr:T9SS type A sorting domain-containing protein [Candidatus Eisenbacteria bacterium]
MKRVSVVATVLLVLGAWMIAIAADPPQDCSISDVQTLQNGIVLGDSVRAMNVIITGVDVSSATYGFWAQDAAGGPFSGILCYTGATFPTGLQRGDIMNVTGVYAEYSTLSEINSYDSWLWEEVGNTTVPDPVLLSCRDVGLLLSDSSRAERWEGVLVKVDTVVVVKHDPAYPTTSYFLVEAHPHSPATSADTMYVRNNKLINPGPGTPDNGDTLVSITGLHTYENSRYHIVPRDGDDIVYLGAAPAPNLAMAYATSNTTIDALFDAKLDETTAENTNNYYLGSATSITLATMSADSMTVTLTTDTQVPGTYETLTACCIKGAGGTVMPAAQNSSFRGGLCPISLVQTPKSAENDSSQYAGDEATIAGIVTGDYGAFTVQCYIENTPGGPWSGVQIYGGIPTPVAEGDSIIVAGFVSEYYYKTEITSVDYLRVVSSGNTIPGPDVVDPSVIRTGASTAESYEGVFVRCNPVFVADTVGYEAFGEWRVSDQTPDTMLVGHTGNYSYIPTVGKWMNICGPIDYVYDNYRIEPRRDADIDTVNVTGVDPGTQPKPQVFALEQNTPNPFNPVTNISFSIPERAEVRLYVYDISGRLVKTLVDGVSMAAGPHKASWDGSNDSGRAVSSGVYFCKLLAADKVAQMKMVVLK